MDILGFIDRTEPGSPTSSRTTPASALLYEDRIARTLPELKQLGRTVFKEVWDEFYDWEPGECAEILGNVPMSVLAPRKELAKLARAMVARFARDTTTPPQGVIGVDSNVVFASMTSYDTRGYSRGRSDNLPIPVVTIDSMDALPPHPPYESCPPASRSVLANVDHEHTLPFLPYADDKDFPALDYLARFGWLEWDTPFDPDLEMIQIEAVRRLHVKHDVDLQDIDRMSFFKPLSVSNNTGLLWEQSQRDFLHWPGAFQVSLEADLPISRAPLPDDLKGRIMSILRTFCPSINCLHAACETHGNLHTSSYVPSRKPTVTGESMRLTEGEPCGLDCFRLIQDFERFRENLPPSPVKSESTGSLDILTTILGIDPDLFPCQLATICLKPCNEIFAQRLQLFPDHTILSLDQPAGSLEPTTDPEIQRESDNLRRSKKRRGKEKLQFADLPDELAACAHPGSCTSNQCPCYVAKQHCTLMCRCGVKCVRQWEGCNCTNGKCMPNSCSCLMDERECIPGICISCDAGGGYNTRPCLNTRLQCMKMEPLEIKVGKYGLGAFARQSLSSNICIGTYTGHILSDAAAEHNSKIAKYTKRNYLFESPIKTTVFDAVHLGNATRFLNHASNGQENVGAKSLLVNGEYQIGFFTSKKIKAGKELFLNYGDNFWREMSVNNMDE